jgi:hypothetical protein
MHRPRSAVSVARIILIAAIGKEKSHGMSHAIKRTRLAKKNEALLLTAIIMLIFNQILE